MTSQATLTPNDAVQPQRAADPPPNSKFLREANQLHREAGSQSSRTIGQPLELLDFKDGKAVFRGANRSIVERDENQNVTSVDYGNIPKQRDFKWEGKELTQVTTSDIKDGKPVNPQTITKDPKTEKWYTQVNGARFYLDGKVDVRPNGDFAIQDKPYGTWHVEGRDGRQFEEQPKIKPGCDVQGRLVKTDSSDKKSTREFEYIEGTNEVSTFKENNKDGTSRTFKRNGKSDEWQVTNEKGEKVNSGVWKGEIITNENGGWAFKEHDNPGRANDPYWHNIDAKGALTMNKINNDKSMVTCDENGNLQRILRPDGTGVECKFENGKKKQIVEFDLNKQTEDVRWNYDDKSHKWVSADGSRKPSEFLMHDDGTYRYKDADGTRHNIKGDGKDEVKPPHSKDGEFVSDSISDAHEELIDRLRPVMSEARLKRIENMMNQFEKRQNDLTEVRTETSKVRMEQSGESAGNIQSKVDSLNQDRDKRVIDTYANIAELATSDSKSALYDQGTRVKLAENFMYHAADPTTMTQGRQGTCWIMSSEVAGGMVGHTDHMARLLKEVSLTGHFDTLNGGLRGGGGPHRVEFSRDLVAMRRDGDYGGGWSLDTANRTSARSPVGMIFDQTLPVIGGRREWNSNAGGYGGGSDGADNIMYMVTGDKMQYGNDYVGRREKEYLLDKGAFVSSGHGHMWGYQMRKQGDNWQIVRDDQYDGGDAVVAQFKDLKSFIQRDFNPGRQLAYFRHQSPGSTDTPDTPVTTTQIADMPSTPGGDEFTRVGPIRRWIRRWR